MSKFVRLAVVLAVGFALLYFLQLRVAEQPQAHIVKAVAPDAFR